MTTVSQEEAIAFMTALAHPVRLSVVRLLAAAGFSGLASPEIAARLALSRQALHRHLLHLLRCNLICRRQDGRIIRYAANIHTVRALIAYLNDQCTAPGLLPPA